jgi:type IV pilus assembly protein PilO
MPKNSSTLIIRVVLGALLAANLVAAGLVLFPPGGSAENLQRQMPALQSQVAQAKARLERTREHVSAVEKGREEGDQFLAGYFLERRTAYSTLLTEIGEAATSSKIKQREYSYSTEPIEGSDTLSMMTITANFDGAYRDVLNFVHELDKSPRLLIVESLNAAPQQNSNVLSVSMKIDTFVRDSPVEAAQSGAAQ